MTKTTLESPVEQKFPPGERILLNSHNKGIGYITFPDRKSTSLLSPLVEAFYKEKEDVIVVNAVVFVDLKVEEENDTFHYSVYQNCYIDVDGNSQVQFFICYNMPEKHSKKFSIHEVSFQVKKEIFIGKLSNVKTIQTFLWDSDPETSRGTVTTVQYGG